MHSAERARLRSPHGGHEKYASPRASGSPRRNLFSDSPTRADKLSESPGNTFNHPRVFWGAYKETKGKRQPQSHSHRSSEDAAERLAGSMSADNIGHGSEAGGARSRSADIRSRDESRYFRVTNDRSLGKKKIDAVAQGTYVRNSSPIAHVEAVPSPQKIGGKMAHPWDHSATAGSSGGEDVVEVGIAPEGARPESPRPGKKPASKDHLARRKSIKVTELGLTTSEKAREEIASPQRASPRDREKLRFFAEDRFIGKRRGSPDHPHLAKRPQSPLAHVGC